MAAKIIAVVNQKGGSGKTTLSMQMAGALARRGKKVLVVDADPQGTATRWAASAEDDNPFPAAVVGLSAASEKVHREVRKFVDNYDFILIDCPPAADSPVPQSALLVADLALVPIIPSPLDMWAAMDKSLTLNAWHWPFMAQPQGFPETLLGGIDPDWFMRHKLLKLTEKANP